MDNKERRNEMAEGKHAMEKGKKEVKQETKESKQNDEIIEIKKENELRRRLFGSELHFISAIQV